jgi:hypothetical protein
LIPTGVSIPEEREPLICTVHYKGGGIGTPVLVQVFPHEGAERSR